jgi:hypothetical protein
MPVLLPVAVTVVSNDALPGLGCHRLPYLAPPELLAVIR